MAGTFESADEQCPLLGDVRVCKVHSTHPVGHYLEVNIWRCDHRQHTDAFLPGKPPFPAHHIRAHCSRGCNQHHVFNMFTCECVNDLLPPCFANLHLGSILPHSKVILLSQAAAQVSSKVFPIAAGIGDEYAGWAGWSLHCFSHGLYLHS